MENREKQAPDTQHISHLAEKTPLERAVAAGIHGPPELKKEEKERYLGIFRDRVIAAFTFEELDHADIEERVLKMLHHPDAGQLRVSSRIDRARAMDFIQMARDRGIRFNLVSDSEGKSNMALVIEEKS